jgi:hypothetical protein
MKAEESTEPLPEETWVLIRQHFKRVHEKWGNKYRYDGGGRGYHKRSVFLHELKWRMILSHVSAAKSQGATHVNWSMRSNSIYYTLGGVNHRVSDHPPHHSFTGLNTLITLP